MLYASASFPSPEFWDCSFRTFLFFFVNSRIACTGFLLFQFTPEELQDCPSTAQELCLRRHCLMLKSLQSSFDINLCEFRIAISYHISSVIYRLSSFRLSHTIYHTWSHIMWHISSYPIVPYTSFQGLPGSMANGCAGNAQPLGWPRDTPWPRSRHDDLLVEKWQNLGLLHLCWWLWESAGGNFGTLQGQQHW